MSADRQQVAGDDGLLAGLSAEQRGAVLADDAALLIVAGPGSGKTRVIAHRIAHAVRARGLDGDRIVAVTFTNRASEEMRARVEELLGAESGARIGTFHWLCQALLRRHAHRIGWPRGFQLLSPRETRNLARATESELWPEGEANHGYAPAMSAVKNGMSLQTAGETFGVGAGKLEQLLAAYDERLRRMGAMDLDDLLAKSVLLLRQHEDIRRRCALAIAELLVDEYQDSNPVQQQLLTLLRPQGGSLVAVGDEDQAIYGWRQAGNGTVEHFRETFPGARVILLRSTHRCSRHILRAASSLIAHNRDRTAKDLTSTRPAGERPVCYAAADERDEAEWIATQIDRVCGRGTCTHDEIAVLYRTNLQARAIEEALVRHDIAYVVRSGLRFYELPEIRVLTAILRLALDAADNQAAALLLERIPGIGDRRRSQLSQQAANVGVSLRALMARSDLPLPAPVRDRIAALSAELERVEIMRRGPVEPVVEAGLQLVKKLLPDRRSAGDDDPLEEVRSMLQEIAPRELSLRSLIDRMTLDGSPSAGRGVSLLSLHAAKGLEFRTVFLAGVDEGLLPHRRSLEAAASLEEERRLCYVGMTRAQELLFMSYAQMRLLGGHAWLGGASRFIGEIGPAHIELRSSPTLRQRPRLSRVRAGERVAHPRWKAGTVIRVEGQGRETIVTIDFGSGGTRRLQLCHAPLERLPAEGRHVAAS